MQVQADAEPLEFRRAFIDAAGDTELVQAQRQRRVR